MVFINIIRQIGNPWRDSAPTGIFRRLASRSKTRRRRAEAI